MAFVKVRPEAGRITVDAAEGAVIVQSGVIKDLRNENERLWERVRDLEKATAAMATLYDRMGELERDRDRLRTENDRLRERINLLERDLDKLANGS